MYIPSSFFMGKTMDPQFQLIFEDRPRRKATSIAQAVNSLFAYLEAILVTYLHSPEAANDEQGWISINIPGDDIKIATPTLAKAILKEYDKVDLYCKSKNLGVFHTASAIEVTLYEQQHHKESKQVSQDTPKIDQTIVSLPSHDDPAELLQPISIEPIDVLQMAEIRIFAYNLYTYLSKSEVPLGTIDRLAQLETGTCLQMLDGVDPMKPTPAMIKSLAKVLCVQPKHLWIDLVPYYLDKTGQRKKYHKRLELVK